MRFNPPHTPLPKAMSSPEPHGRSRAPQRQQRCEVRSTKVEGERDMDVTISTTCYIYIYILPIECLLTALDAHMFSHNGYGSWPHIHYG